MRTIAFLGLLAGAGPALAQGAARLDFSAVQRPEPLFARAVRHAIAVEPQSVRDLLLVQVVMTQAEVGDDRGAQETLKHVSADQEALRLTILMEIAVGQASHHRMEDALKTLENIRAGGHRDWTAGRIAVLQEKAGDRLAAAQTLRRIAGADRKLSALLEIASVRIAARDPAAAKETLAQAIELVLIISEQHVRAERWANVAQVQAELGDRRAAQESFQRARKAAEAVDPEVRGLVLYKVIAGQAKAHELDGAWEATRLLGDEKDNFGTPIKDKAIRAIAEAHARAGRVAQAEEAIRQINGLAERAHALAVVAETEAAKGEPMRAKQRLKEAQQLADKDSGQKLLALAAIAHAMIGLKDFDGARAIAQSIDVGISDELLKDIAAAECRAGNTEAALRTFRSIKNGSWVRHKDTAAQIIAAERTKKKDAETLLWAEQLETPSERASAFLGIAEGLKSPAR
jgi:tetratricopeptide (TPR) repeat protein